MAVAWQWFEYTVTERRKEGLSQWPIAAAEPSPSKILRTSAAYGLRSIRWVVASLAEWPEVPAFYGATRNRVPDESEINFRNPIPADGATNYLHIAFGVFHYFLVNARPADSDFSVGDMPPTVANLGTAEKSFPAAKFRRFLDTGSLY